MTTSPRFKTNNKAYLWWVFFHLRALRGQGRCCGALTDPEGQPGGSQEDAMSGRAGVWVVGCVVLSCPVLLSV